MRDFSKIQIKHADWPYILTYFTVYFVLAVAAGFLLNETGFFVFLIILSVFFLILTQFHIYRLQKKESEYLQYKIQAIHELNNLLPLNAPLPPMTGWAATPELAIALHKYIHLFQPKVIVEFGSGVSTLIAACSLRLQKIDGKVISFEHNAAFHKKSARNLQLHQLSDLVELRIAELKNVEIDGRSWKWYNPETLKFDAPIDLLIVDGPPVKTQKNARYPALPLLYPHLSANAVIIVHDTKRPAEGEIIKQWLNDYDDFTSTEEFGEKGITVLERRAP